MSSFLFAQNLSEVKSFAERHILQALEMIPQGQEYKYGLESRAEFMQCTVGEPLRMSELSTDGVVQLQNYWRVPVVLDGKYRHFMTVILNDENQLELVGVGGLVLAENIQMERNSGKDIDMIIRVYSHQMDFAGSLKNLDNTDNMILYPLHSAKNFIVDKNMSLYTEYKLSQVIVILQSTSKK